MDYYKKRRLKGGRLHRNLPNINQLVLPPPALLISASTYFQTIPFIPADCTIGDDLIPLLPNHYTTNDDDPDFAFHRLPSTVIDPLPLHLDILPTYTYSSLDYVNPIFPSQRICTQLLSTTQFDPSTLSHPDTYNLPINSPHDVVLMTPLSHQSHHYTLTSPTNDDSPHIIPTHLLSNICCADTTTPFTTPLTTPNFPLVINRLDHLPYSYNISHPHPVLSPVADALITHYHPLTTPAHHQSYCSPSTYSKTRRAIRRTRPYPTISPFADVLTHTRISLSAPAVKTDPLSLRIGCLNSRAIPPLRTLSGLLIRNSLAKRLYTTAFILPTASLILP
jgi:hypothetical protein